eukprot:2303382-Alexandrium_andersonii.AAC.1
MLEAITGRLPSSFTDEPLFASAQEYAAGLVAGAGIGYGEYDYPPDGQYPVIPLDERAGWVNILTPRRVPRL